MTTEEMRALDLVMAKDVMCFPHEHLATIESHGCYFPEPKKIGRFWRPTTDSAAALEVLKKCIEKNVGIRINPIFGAGGDDAGGYYFSCNDFKVFGIGETLELAICKFDKALFTTPQN